MATKVSTAVQAVAKSDRAAALAFFLMDQGLGIFDKWKGTLSAADQRTLFGYYLGKGCLFIDGANETVRAVVSVAYGTDWDTVVRQPWTAFQTGIFINDAVSGFYADTGRYPALKKAFG